jgi:hypothetical protein
MIQFVAITCKIAACSSCRAAMLLLLATAALTVPAVVLFLSLLSLLLPDGLSSSNTYIMSSNTSCFSAVQYTACEGITAKRANCNKLCTVYTKLAVTVRQLVVNVQMTIVCAICICLCVHAYLL